MKYWNTRLKKLSAYVPGEQPANINEYIKLNTNESPFSPSEKVLQAIQKNTTASLRLYPDPLATEVRKIFAKEHGLELENIMVGNGSDEIFNLIFKGLIEPNKTVGLLDPSYSLYDTLAEANDINVKKISLEKDFAIKLSPFLKIKTDLIILTNPNNPTGTYCPVEKINDFLSQYKGLLVIDEAYIDFYGGSAINLIKKYDNLIITRSFSKSYSLAGLRLGLAIASENLIAGLLKIKDSYNINRLAIIGAQEALLDKKHLDYNLQMIKNNKEFLEEQLIELGCQIIPSRANFLFFKHPQISSELLYQEFKKRKILVRHFPNNIAGDYIRVSIGTMMELKTFCKEFREILAT